MGLTPTWLNYGGTGGCSATGGVARAASAIREGMCEVVVVLSADAPSTAWRANYGAYRSEFQDPPGVQGPPATFGLLMSRYQHQFGIKPEALGKIAITQREHALHNENAYRKFKTPITMEDYQKSRVIADPLRLLDCVMFCDGANAFLVTSETNAPAASESPRWCIRPPMPKSPTSTATSPARTSPRPASPRSRRRSTSSRA